MVKTLDDYIDKIKIKYPYVPRQELYEILQHGFIKYFELNRLGADVEIENHLFDAYCGRKYRDLLVKTKYNTTKLRQKLHMQYNYTQQEYDGYYYLGMTDEDYNIYKTTSTQGILKIPMTFFKVKDEVLYNNKYKHFFSLCYPIDVG